MRTPHSWLALHSEDGECVRYSIVNRRQYFPDTKFTFPSFPPAIKFLYFPSKNQTLLECPSSLDLFSQNLSSIYHPVSTSRIVSVVACLDSIAF